MGVDIQHGFALSKGAGIQWVSAKTLLNYGVDQALIFFGQNPHIHITHGSEPNILIDHIQKSHPLQKDDIDSFLIERIQDGIQNM